jgi:hypothetical protein
MVKKMNKVFIVDEDVDEAWEKTESKLHGVFTSLDAGINAATEILNECYPKYEAKIEASSDAWRATIKGNDIEVWVSVWSIELDQRLDAEFFGRRDRIWGAQEKEGVTNDEDDSLRVLLQFVGAKRR